MSIKQDRGGVRTAQDLERKYDFSSLVSIKKNVELQQEAITKTNTTLEEYIDAVSDMAAKVDKTVHSIDVMYALGDSAVNAPTTDWNTVAPQWQEGKYMWQKTVTTYTDGSTEPSTPTCISGAKGKDGTSVNILGSYTTLEELQTAHPTGNIGDAYIIGGNLYVWSESNNVWEDVGTIQGPQGEVGPPGETGIGVKRIEEQYCLSTSKSAPIGGSWKFTQDAWTEGKYVWTRSKVTWTDGTASYTTATLASAINSANELANKAANKITTFFYSGKPTLTNMPASEWTTDELKAEHVNSLYYDKDTGYAYIFNEAYSWEQVKDKDVIGSLALANAAKDTADGKRRVFITTPEPPYDNGDLWVTDGDIYICQLSKAAEEEYAEGDFVIATKYTDDTYAKQVGDNLTVLEGTVLEVQKSVNEYKIEFETKVTTIQNETKEHTEALETMSYSFGTNDLKIANSNDPVNARINNQGLKVYSYNELKQITNHKGVGAQDLIVVGYSQLGNLRITKAVDDDGNACTDFHHLVSNIETLSDLE